MCFALRRDRRILGSMRRNGLFSTISIVVIRLLELFSPSTLNKNYLRYLIAESRSVIYILKKRITKFRNLIRNPLCRTGVSLIGPKRLFCILNIILLISETRFPTFSVRQSFVREDISSVVWRCPPFSVDCSPSAYCRSRSRNRSRSPLSLRLFSRNF